MDPITRKKPRGPGLALLIVGIVFVAVGAGTRQTAFLTLGPSLVAIGVVLLANARRHAS